MIHNDEHLQETRLAIANLESVLASLKHDVLPKNPERFAIMAEPAVVDIMKLRAEVDEYIGLTAARFEEAEFWMRLSGQVLWFGDAPASIVGTALKILRSGILSVAEFRKARTAAAIPASVLKEACDPRIVTWTSGSLRVGLRLPDVLHQAAGEHAREALYLYLDAAAWVGSGTDVEQLEDRISDSEFRRLLLNQVSRLIPRQQGGLESVELSGRRMGPVPIVLRRDDRKRVRIAVERSAQQDLLDTETLITVEGLLREIDLDRRTFIIRDRAAGTQIPCQTPPESDDLLDIAKQALDHRVLVVGKRAKPIKKGRFQPLDVLEIEELGTTPDEGGD
jgi:hypothetical protein